MNDNQQLIQRIIDMDKDARRLMNEAMDRRAGSAKAISEKQREVSENFLTMARTRVDVIRTTEMEHADEQLETGNKRRQSVLEGMDAAYAAHREEWVTAIVSRVTDGDDLI